MSNKLNPFEEQLKKAADSHQVPYDSTQWDALNKQLDINSTKPNPWFKWGVVAALIATVAIAVNVYLPENTDKQVVVTPVENVTSKEESKPQVVENKLVENTPTEVLEIEKEESTDDYLDETNQNVVVEEKLVSVKEQKVTPEITESQKVLEVDSPKDPITTTAVKIPEIILEKTKVCAGVEAIASLSFDTDLEVVWMLGNGETLTGSEMKYSYPEGGEYEVKALFSKLNVYSESVKLTILPKPDASFTVKENMANEMVPVVELAANTGGEKSYSWTFGDGFVYHGEEVSHVYTQAKDYEISLRVMNKYGCFWTNYHRYTKDRAFNLLAPNSFTPNADGDNDEWIPVALTTDYFQFEVNVYDRNGKLVFTSKSSEQRFDGRVNGKLVPSGEVFIWKASTIDPEGMTQMYGGTIMAIY